MTKKKRFMICLSNEDLYKLELLKRNLKKKQLSKIISYLLNQYIKSL